MQVSTIPPIGGEDNEYRRTVERRIVSVCVFILSIINDIHRYSAICDPKTEPLGHYMTAILLHFMFFLGIFKDVILVCGPDSEATIDEMLKICKISGVVACLLATHAVFNMNYLVYISLLIGFVF